MLLSDKANLKYEVSLGLRCSRCLKRRKHEETTTTSRSFRTCYDCRVYNRSACSRRKHDVLVQFVETRDRAHRENRFTPFRRVQLAQMIALQQRRCAFCPRHLFLNHNLCLSRVIFTEGHHGGPTSC